MAIHFAISARRKVASTLRCPTDTHRLDAVRMESRNKIGAQQVLHAGAQNDFSTSSRSAASAANLRSAIANQKTATQIGASRPTIGAKEADRRCVICWLMLYSIGYFVRIARRECRPPKRIFPWRS